MSETIHVAAEPIKALRPLWPDEPDNPDLYWVREYTVQLCKRCGTLLTSHKQDPYPTGAFIVVSRHYVAIDLRQTTKEATCTRAIQA